MKNRISTIVFALALTIGAALATTTQPVVGEAAPQLYHAILNPADYYSDVELPEFVTQALQELEIEECAFIPGGWYLEKNAQGQHRFSQARIDQNTEWMVELCKDASLVMLNTEGTWLWEVIRHPDQHSKDDLIDVVMDYISIWAAIRDVIKPVDLLEPPKLLGEFGMPGDPEYKLANRLCKLFLDVSMPEGYFKYHGGWPDRIRGRMQVASSLGLPIYPVVWDRHAVITGEDDLHTFTALTTAQLAEMFSWFEEFDVDGAICWSSSFLIRDDPDPAGRQPYQRVIDQPELVDAVILQWLAGAKIALGTRKVIDPGLSAPVGTHE